MVVGDDIGHDNAVVGLVDVDVLWLEEARNAQLAVGDGERVVQALGRAALGQLGVVDQVGPVLVDEGVEGEAVAPRGGEVAHVHVRVVGGLDLAPEEEGVLGRALLARLPRPRRLRRRLLVREGAVRAVGGAAASVAALGDAERRAAYAAAVDGVC